MAYIAPPRFLSASPSVFPCKHLSEFTTPVTTHSTVRFRPGETAFRSGSIGRIFGLEREGLVGQTLGRCGCEETRHGQDGAGRGHDGGRSDVATRKDGRNEARRALEGEGEAAATPGGEEHQVSPRLGACGNATPRT